MASRYRKGDIVLSWAPDGKHWKIGESISFHIFIKEVYPNVLSTFKGDLLLTYTEKPISGQSQYFQNEKIYLKKGQLRSEMTLKPYKGATVSNVPSRIKIELKNENTVIESVYLGISADMFLGHLFETQSKNKADILLFGLAGSGKSSFINSVITAMNDVITPIKKAVAGGHERRVTTALKSWSLPRLTDKKVCNYRLWDTWGLEPENYQGCEFKKILLGEVSSGWEMEKAVIESEFDISAEVDPTKKKSVVIFVVESGSFVGDPNDDPNVIILRNKMNETTNTGVHSIVALSKADLVGYDIEEGADNSKFEEYRVKAANFFRLGQNQVFPLVTYANVKEKKFQVDRLILDIVLHAFNAAKLLPTDSSNNNNNNNDDDEWLFNQ